MSSPTGFIDAYAVLGVSPKATAAELKAAHRRLVRRHHPDLAPPELRAAATRRTQELNHAYGLLRDAAARAEYDRLRRLHAARAGAAAAPAAADAELARQWEAASRAAGRWAARWWRRHGAAMRRAGRRTRRAGIDVVGRVLWLLTCVLWAAIGLVTAAAAQRLVGVDGSLTPALGVIAGALVGSQRGWQRRLRLAGYPAERAAARIALAFGAGALVLGLLADARFSI